MMRLYIVGPEDGGAGQYELLTSAGESLTAHTCPNIGEAAYLLGLGTAVMRAELTLRFGHWDVLLVCGPALRREMRRRRTEFYHKPPEDVTGTSP